jgi:hypothetical protein
MWGYQSPQWEKIGTYLFQILSDDSIDAQSWARILRALGQIRYDKNSFFITLGKLLKEQNANMPSIYSTLALIGSREAASVCLRRLKAIGKSTNLEEEISHNINALVRLVPILDLAPVEAIEDEITEKYYLQILVLLTYGKSKKFIKLVNQSLQTSKYQDRMLAIAAAKHNNNKETWTLLFNLLDDFNPSLAGRAIDSICHGGGAIQHRNLLDWLKDNENEKTTYLKIFRSITPNKNESYLGVISRIDDMIKQNKGVMEDKEIQHAARELKDNLVISNSFTDKKNSPKTSLTPHNLDTYLSQNIKNYDQYPEIIKAVLRNAELTWQHPELFNDQVDKSTMVIQFTKSIDLLMQDRIGSYIFLKPNSPILSQMQSTIMFCRADDESISASQRVDDFSCSSSFDPESFPNHKLSLICQSIMSGKITTDQYRIIDGLRAWSLFILLFGRKFKTKSKEILPLLPVQVLEEKEISQIAYQMNGLQEIRNRAAHRGTLFEQTQLEQVRIQSFQILNKLSEYLIFN